MDINAAVGGKVGLSRQRIEVALGFDEAHDLPERERLALEYAGRVSATPVDVPDGNGRTPLALAVRACVDWFTIHLAAKEVTANAL